MSRLLFDIDPASAQLLLSISELGSISKAADRHGLSQPSASRRMRDLERKLGIRLLERTANGAELSADGARLIRHCQALVRASQDLIDAAGTVRAEEQQTLHLAATPLAMRFIVPRLNVAISTELAGVDVSLSTADTLAGSNGVRDGGFDLALVDGPRPPVGVSSRELIRHRLIPVVGPRHSWWRRRSPVGAAQLTAGPLWLPPRGSGSRDVIDEALILSGSTRPPVTAGAVDTDQRLGLIALGTYPGIVRADVAASLIAEQALRSVQCEVRFEQPVRLIWRGRRPATEAARRFADLAVEWAEGAQANATPQR